MQAYGGVSKIEATNGKIAELRKLAQRTRVTEKVQCFPLYSMLLALGKKKILNSGLDVS